MRATNQMKPKKTTTQGHGLKTDAQLILKCINCCRMKLTATGFTTVCLETKLKGPVHLGLISTLMLTLDP